jgi:hypothetical protein
LNRAKPDRLPPRPATRTGIDDRRDTGPVDAFCGKFAMRSSEEGEVNVGDQGKNQQENPGADRKRPPRGGPCGLLVQRIPEFDWRHLR